MTWQRRRTWWQRSGDWLNQPLFAPRRRLFTAVFKDSYDIRVIDGMMVLMGAGIFSYYLYVHNWQQAVMALLTYILVWMVAQWLL